MARPVLKPAEMRRFILATGLGFMISMAGYMCCLEYGTGIVAARAVGIFGAGMNLGCLYVIGRQHGRMRQMRYEWAHAAIDPRVLDQLRVLMDDEFTAILRNYLDITPKLLAELSAATAYGRMADVVRVSHRLRSASAQLGADRFAALAGDIEYAARVGDLETVPDLLAEALAAFRKVNAALQVVGDG